MKYLAYISMVYLFSNTAFAININQFERSNSLTFESIEDARSRTGHVINDYKWLGTIGYSFVGDPLVVKNSANTSQRSSIITDLHTLHLGFSYFVNPKIQLGATTGFSFFKDHTKDDKTAFNDLNLKAKIRIFQNDKLALSLMPVLTAPIDKKKFDIVDSNGVKFGKQTLLSDNSFGYGIKVLGERTFKHFQLILNLGYRYSKDADFTDNNGFTHIDMTHQLYSAMGVYVPFSKKWGANVEFIKLWSLPLTNKDINPNELFVGTSFGIIKNLHGFLGVGLGNIIGNSDSDGNDIRYSAGIKFHISSFDRRSMGYPVVIDPPKQKCQYQLFDSGNIGTIRFKNDKYSINPEDQYSLRTVVSAIKSKSNIIQRVDIVGHASAPASKDHNLILSKNRANTIKNFMIQNGVSANKIQVDWSGEGVLVSPGASKTSDEENRRVEFKVIFKNCEK